MLLTPGAQLGPYEITGLVGAGGMGEVYRAKDVRLGRTVAVKVLPPDTATGASSASPVSASRADRRRRFEQEARAASTLNHPHICVLYDIGSAPVPGDATQGATIDYLVMEFLEGQTLAERLEKGPLPLREVVGYGAQVADALAKAHRHGILHRDIKPGNVMLTKAGVKLLDFGLAKARPGSRAADAGVTVPLTQGLVTGAGLVVGTVPYMAPEALQGKEADPRTDIFALGAVLYEMVSGRRAFGGDNQASLIAAILTSDPPPLTAGSGVAPAAPPAASASGVRTGLGTAPPSLDRLIRRCLAKDPDDRWQSADAIARQLEGLAEEWRLPGAGTDTLVAATGPAASARRRVAMSLGLVALVSLVLGGSYLYGQRAVFRPQPTFHRLTFRQGSIQGARFTPDGQTVIYTARWDGRDRETFTVPADGVDSERRDTLRDLLVRSISVRNEVAASRDGILAIAPLSGGAPRDLVGAVSADWSPDGRELAVSRRNKGVRAIEYPLGNVVYRASKPDVGLYDVRASPTGDLVAFTETSQRIYGHVVIVDRTGKTRVQSGFHVILGGPAWSPDGTGVWFTAATPLGQETVRALDLSGRERLLLRMPGLKLLDVGRSGRVLLLQENRGYSLFGRAPGETTERNLTYYGWSLLDDLSPDGRTVVFTEGGESNREADWSVFIRPTDGSPPQEVGRGRHVYGKISPNGKWVAANTFTDQGAGVAILPVGAGEERVLTKLEDAEFRIAGWLPDSSAVLYYAHDRTWLAPVSGTPRPITPEGWFVSGGGVPGALKERAIAPDGRHFMCGHFDPDDDWFYLCEIDAPVSTALPKLFDGSKWHAVGWTPDGKRLRVHDFSPGVARRFYLLDPTTGRAEPWKVVGAGIDPTGTDGINRILFGDDGESYVYQIGRNLGTLYVAEGIR